MTYVVQSMIYNIDSNEIKVFQPTMTSNFSFKSILYGIVRTYRSVDIPRNDQGIFRNPPQNLVPIFYGTLAVRLTLFDCELVV